MTAGNVLKRISYEAKRHQSFRHRGLEQSDGGVSQRSNEGKTNRTEVRLFRAKLNQRAFRSCVRIFFHGPAALEPDALVPDFRSESSASSMRPSSGTASCITRSSPISGRCWSARSFSTPMPAGLEREPSAAAAEGSSILRAVSRGMGKSTSAAIFRASIMGS